jgi:hypothetical protein
MSDTDSRLYEAIEGLRQRGIALPVEWFADGMASKWELVAKAEALARQHDRERQAAPA